MRVLLINSVCGIRSTGRICTDIADAMSRDGHEVKIAYGRESVPERYMKYAVKIGKSFDSKVHGVLTRAFDRHGFGSKNATRRFLKWADEYNPDLLWLHNLHGYYINVEMLFSWIKSRPNMQVKWTLHDCWAFTGHCTYFTMAGCDQWKSGCHGCVQKKAYPTSYLADNSKNNYERKRAAFTGVSDMTLITPSKWLSDLVGESFLSGYKTEVHYNTVDTSVFKPTPSNFKERMGLSGKKIILGVASVWEKRKGLDDFIKLSDLLDDKYVIVLVGLSTEQIKLLPKRIVGIERTKSTRELVEIYTAADVFVNPSREESFGMTTLEAISCGTKAIVYKDTACEEVANMYGGARVITCRTGGDPETIRRENAAVVMQGDVEAVLKIIDTWEGR